MDILAATEALSLAAIVGSWLLLVSSRLDQSKARTLVRLWCAIVGVGAIIGFVAGTRLGKTAGVVGDGDECHHIG